jgi:hypothetical protein
VHARRYAESGSAQRTGHWFAHRSKSDEPDARNHERPFGRDLRITFAVAEAAAIMTATPQEVDIAQCDEIRRDCDRYGMPPNVWRRNWDAALSMAASIHVLEDYGQEQ